ncbi:zinc finger protein SNAI1 [Galendromus occidentalis]|uniref:Zinc finger protein SNAI1 n=1 Tax=Galendromus occidentalis TaxID=34638 RepID=A0AAJ7WJI3_9ACAR|nr:zinc finger protein SNAI1 [Galendromus occidentalis]
MPKAFLIKKKHEAMLAAQITGVKRPWLDDMELPEDLSRSSASPTLSYSPTPSVSPALSISPAPSDCSATVPDMAMPFDLSTKRRCNEASEPVVSPSTPAVAEWPRFMMPIPHLPYTMPAMSPFYYPMMQTFSPQIVSHQPMVPLAQQDVAVVPSWASEDKESPKKDVAAPLSPSDSKGSFSCRFCSKSYVSMGALKMHIRTHTLPCKCDICGKAFSRPWLLQGHIRTHTGEKPFECEHCHRAFADRSNLRAHLQTHQEVKKYSCTRCSKTFSRMSLLQKHQDSGACCQVLPRPSPQSSPAAVPSA